MIKKKTQIQWWNNKKTQIFQIPQWIIIILIKIINNSNNYSKIKFTLKIILKYEFFNINK